MNLSVGSLKVSVEDVLLKRVVEEQGLLLHETEPLTKCIHIHGLDIDIVNENRSKLRVIETHDERDESGLALTGLTNDRDVIFRVDCQVETLEDPLL